MRDYISSLKSMGINLTPEIKNVRGWVARQGQKSFAGNLIKKVPGIGMLGEVIKHGL